MDTLSLIQAIPGLGLSVVFVIAWYITETKRSKEMADERLRFDALVNRMVSRYEENAQKDSEDIVRLQKERDAAYRRLGLRTNTGDDPASTQPKPPNGGL